MSFVYGFCKQIKKCNDVVKTHDTFTKLPLLTIGIFSTIINAKREYNALKIVYKIIIRGHNWKIIMINPLKNVNGGSIWYIIS
jgi:hypothetical protein